MPTIQQQYKGIVLCGLAGTGKSTAAKVLTKQIPQNILLEVSKVILPTSRQKLPRHPKDLLRLVTACHKTNQRTPGIPRVHARGFFVTLRSRYGKTIIAKIIIQIQKKIYPHQMLILSGVRKYADAQYLFRNGYYIAYLTAPKKILERRLASRENYKPTEARRDYREEKRLYQTTKIAHIAQATIDSSKLNPGEIAIEILRQIRPQECRKCTNSTVNPTIAIAPNGLCLVCNQYRKHFNTRQLAGERRFFTSLIGTGKGAYDVMVGLSGGKDSTTTLYTVKQLGFTPLAFTFDIGYYPKHIFTRSQNVARELGVDHIVIPIKKYIRNIDRLSYKKTAALYERKNSEELRQTFRNLYRENRSHYSAKCRHALPFVRTCQLCRRVVIRAYYAEALKHGVNTIVLGVNEWTGLSQNSKSKQYTISAIRRLKPDPSKPTVYIVHLPFLLQRKLTIAKKILKELGWKQPRGEDMIESNANSCLLARASEQKATQLLGFHPDSMRLAREVTARFITKNQACKALGKSHPSRQTVRKVLKQAGIL